MRRRAISRGKSQRNFVNHTIPRSSNLPLRHMRGGYRL